jgi:Family of unknown function (DUF5764)
MDNFDGGVSVYSEAKGEYTKQLTLFIVPSFHRFFMNCLEQSYIEEVQPKKQLWKFQEFLSQIPEWNMDKVQREVQKIIGEIQCDYLEELVTAVFIAHTKVLTAIRIGNKNKRVQITIPKLEHFIHRALSESSRLLWSSAYLFQNELPPIEKQKNHRQIEQLLHEGVAQAIRGLLPVKNILKDYLAEPEGNEDAEEADDEADATDATEATDAAEGAEDAETKVVEAKVVENERVVSKVEATEPDVVKAIAPEAVATEVDAPETDAAEAKPVETPEAVTTSETSMSNNAEQEVQVDTKMILTPALSESTSNSQPSSQIHLQKVTETFTSMKVSPEEHEKTPAPTLIIDTEPTVCFTDFNQVIQQNGDQTHIGYVETNHNTMYNHDSNENRDTFSDFEETMNDLIFEPMNVDDFEVLE